MKDRNEIGSKRVAISQFITHPDWNTQNLNFDGCITIMVLRDRITYSAYIRPICLWNYDDNLQNIIGQNGVVAGWGQTEQTSKNYEFPVKISTPVISNNVCHQQSSFYARIASSGRTFCAGRYNNREGPCTGK